MKKLLTMILALTMVLAMSVPVFADEIETEVADTPAAPAETVDPVAPSDPVTPAEPEDPAVEMTAQVKAIKPAAKAASYSYTKIKVSWKAIEDIDGYKVYRATKKSGKFSLVKTVSNPDTTSYINTDRTTGKTYYYKVRGFKKIDGKTVYTKYSDIKSAYARPSKAKISSIIIPWYDKGKAKLITEYYGSTKVTRYVWNVSKANSYKGFKVTWNKVSGASGYQLYMRQKGKSKWTSKGYYTDTSAKVNFNMEKQYEFKVRAYRNVNGKKIYGLCSPISSYKFKWDIDDLKKVATKVIEEYGYEYNDQCVDSELGYDIITPASIKNCGWSGPYHVSYYYSLEYIKAFTIRSNLTTVIEDHQTNAYCLYFSKKATEYGEHNKPTNRGDELPLCYEIYFLSNGSAYSK